MARASAALLGNYALTLGIASLLAVILSLVGVERPEAVALVSMLAFIFYLVIVLVAFHTRRLLRFWCWIGATAAASYAAAQFLAGSIP